VKEATVNLLQLNPVEVATQLMVEDFTIFRQVNIYVVPLSFIQSYDPELQRQDSRVARWFVFKPKIQIWVNFGGCFKDGICILRTLILRSFVIFYGHFVQFVVIWYIFPVLVFCNKKNLATLQDSLVCFSKILFNT
jgi:hypothetical protein